MRRCKPIILLLLLLIGGLAQAQDGFGNGGFGGQDNGWDGGQNYNGGGLFQRGPSLSGGQLNNGGIAGYGEQLGPGGMLNGGLLGYGSPLGGGQLNNGGLEAAPIDKGWWLLCGFGLCYMVCAKRHAKKKANE